MDFFFGTISKNFANGQTDIQEAFHIASNQLLHETKQAQKEMEKEVSLDDMLQKEFLLRKSNADLADQNEDLKRRLKEQQEAYAQLLSARRQEQQADVADEVAALRSQMRTYEELISRLKRQLLKAQRAATAAAPTADAPTHEQEPASEPSARSDASDTDSGGDDSDSEEPGSDVDALLAETVRSRMLQLETENASLRRQLSDRSGAGQLQLQQSASQTGAGERGKAVPLGAETVCSNCKAVLTVVGPKRTYFHTDDSDSDDEGDVGVLSPLVHYTRPLDPIAPTAVNAGRSGFAFAKIHSAPSLAAALGDMGGDSGGFGKARTFSFITKPKT